MMYRKLNIQKILKEYDEDTKRLLQETDDIESTCRAFRRFGRAMLEAELICMKNWIETCELIGEKGRSKVLDFTYKMLPWLKDKED